MNNLMIFLFYMLVMFKVTFLMSIYVYYLDQSFLFEWMIFSYNSFNMEFILLVDWISLIFISFVLLISSMVMLYSSVYMSGEKFINRFSMLVVLFIVSMILMIISPNLISILFGWDGLGLISYCLVIYYQNYSSYNSGMLTVLCNRVGDIGLLMAIGLVMIYGSWNIFLLDDNKMIVFMLVLASITKSAQVPFSSWLPSAMAAPTPVSALVHSSTLVTAGIYLMIRYNKFLMLSDISLVLLFISLITMFMSGLMANFEYDFKKIIALSTLSQLGLMMMILSLGLSLMSLYHLLTHAIFKSLLFLCAGAVIHVMNNNQDIRFYGNLGEFMPLVMSSFYVSNLSLCGYPFLAGFYTKDLIMEIFYFEKVNIMVLIMAMISLMLTVSYTFRLIIFIFFGKMNFMSSYYIEENFMINISMILLMLFSMFSGSMLFWMFFYDFIFVYLDLKIKFMTLIMCFMGIFLGAYIYLKNFLNVYYMIYFFSSMWYMDNMYKCIYEPIFYRSLEVSLMDKSWLEFVKKISYVSMIKNFSMNSIKQFKIFMFIYLFMMFILFFNLN